jgi:hypothetical protein
MKVKIQRVVINPEAFFYIMCSDTAWRVSKGIPKGAKLRGFTLDPMTQNLHLFVEHESFPEVEITRDIAPLLATEFRRIT